MSKLAPASSPIPTPNSSSRNASTRPRRCSAPRKRPNDLRARRGGGNSDEARAGPGMTTADESNDMNAKADRERAPKWKHDGVRVIPGHALDPNTPQTPGMDRKAAVNYARGLAIHARRLWG